MMATHEKKPIESGVIERHEDVGEAAHTTKDAIADASARGQGLSGYEDLNALETAKKFKMCTLLCFLATLSAATDGYQIGLVGNIYANPGFVNQFGTGKNADGDTVIRAPIMAVWQNMASVGQIFGMVGMPFFSDRFGRKCTMYGYCFILALSVMVECVANTWQVWLAGKILGGLGVGCMQSGLPTYISEVAPVRIRGALLMCYSLWFITGQFFAPVALQVLSEQNANDYKTAIYTQWSQIGLMFLIYLLLPESPAWCVAKGKMDQAKAVLRYLYKGVTDFDVDHQLNLLVLNLEHERALAAEQANEKWYAIFKGRDGFRTLVSCWTLMCQHWIGLGMFFVLGTYFFQQAGIGDPFKVTCITSGINIAFSIIVVFLADTTGRRQLACYGTTLCWVCCVLTGILGVIPSTAATNKAFVAIVCFWNIGLVANGATAWGFIGEISSQRLRPYTAGFAAASVSIVGIAAGVLVPYMVTNTEWNWGLKAGWFFAGAGLPFTLGVWFLVPETQGRSAAELDELFERKIKPWQFHKTITATQRIAEAEKSEK